MHVTADGHCRSQTGSQWTEPAARGFCYGAIRLAEMTLIDGPRSRQVNGHIYGFAMLAESHVAVHLDADASLAYLELFSCKDFDAEVFARLCINMFNLENLRLQVFDRGLH